jgi:hypothetical protein
MQTKVSEIDARYRFSPDAIYAWVCSGLIPAGCVVRLGNSIRIDSDEFDRLMRAGKLYKPTRSVGHGTRGDIAAGAGSSEDNHTLKGGSGGAFKPNCEHRFMDEGGSVNGDHPYTITRRLKPPPRRPPQSCRPRCASEHAAVM